MPPPVGKLTDAESTMIQHILYNDVDVDEKNCYGTEP